MPEQTIYIFDRTAITVTNLSGGAPRNGNVINNAQNGNAFAWENPNDLRLTFPSVKTAITFNDADGILSDDPYLLTTVTDQRLTQPVTVGGQTFTPNTSLLRWQSPAPVTVENEYEVTLYDSAGTMYRMVGVSITTGYSTNVVGVMFEGAQPPAGVPLFYRQGLSTYTDNTSTPIPTGVICFHAGTGIATPRGPRLIETLRIGDLVNTLDAGPRPLRWIGHSQVPGRGDLAPIRIAEGALGNDRDLLVSPNHRMLIGGALADLHFGEPEVLVAAKHLLRGEAIHRAPCRWASYLHLALDRHEIILAEGIGAESLHSGPMALASLSALARADLQAALPGFGAANRLARRCLTRAESLILTAGGRHLHQGWQDPPACRYAAE